MAELTTDDLFAEYERLAAGPNGGHTSEDLASLWGCSMWKVRKMLKFAQSKGWLQIVWTTRRGVDGRSRAVPSYRINSKAKKAKIGKK